ncbi:prolyl oligopeptidase family serine peptidase [Paenibacillus macerans]|uniref:prolyl oligopeptidase family serine peptidase n=1 Tax=Paenibacillus macerans TaxID=44252 RepID=UPI002DBA4575|nr:prolyl oligopeptidase family serine peptidase [Paenibacillus macerans]MEC0135701.1 prolyl oligopeptidase family serine peptidase [Paenibacillus macerans]
MITSFRKAAKTTALLALAVTTTLAFSSGAWAKETSAAAPSYRTVVEVEDFGAQITKLIVDLGQPIPKNAVTKETFTVHVKRSDSRLDDPLIAEGDRKVTKAYVADQNGNPAKETGRYAVLEMEIGPEIKLSPAMNYVDVGVWNDNKHTVTQQKDITTESGVISGLVIDNSAGEIRELVDEFNTGKAAYEGVTLTYADYTPAKDKKKNPLVIWLHGMGEGGTDPTITIAGNKAVNFASKDIQSYFGGAYVLAPQTPTYWMDGFNGFGDGTSKYEKALMSLIRDYVAKNKDIDPKRIYIGGDSNGGYMTMLMIRDYKDYFAAAFVACEALKDSLITDKQIKEMKDLPIWFIAAKTDTVVPPIDYTVSTYSRLVNAGAKDVHMSLFNNVSDTSGLYKKSDGTPYEYNGHWSWIYVYNNDVSKVINGKNTTLMEWLASKKKK